MIDTERLIEQAQADIAANDCGEYIAPHKDGAFPDEFAWDSDFIIVGLAHTNPKWSMQIAMRQSHGLWANGKRPNQRLASRTLSIVEKLNFRSTRSPHAPAGVHTSGISQPTVLADAVNRLVPELSQPDAEELLDEVIPTLSAIHQWNHDERGVSTSGLLIQIHPYETGMDNSPPFLELVRQQYKGLITLLGNSAIAKATDWGFDKIRRDLKFVDPDQRMTNADVAAYQMLTRRIGKHRYEFEDILRDPKVPLLVDTTYNFIHARNNAKLQELADIANVKLPQKLLEDMFWHKEGLEDLWNGDDGYYQSQNFRTGELVPIRTIGSLMALYSGVIDQERVDVLVSQLTDEDLFWCEYPVPSVSMDEKKWYEPKRYWQGATWLWMNWFIVEGLENYGYSGLANEIRRRTLEAVSKFGAGEYMHPHTGERLGVHPFSGAAAVVIDFAMRLQQ